jgi:uncharacterized membrane protein (UPF0127 family)
MYRRIPQGKQRDLMVVLFVFISAWFFAACTAHAQTKTALPIKKLNAGMHIIQAEVAATPESRTTGLMYRKSLAPNHGMLFVFEQPNVQCFWMRNTFIPLSIAFLQEDGTIVNIADMTPQSDQSHCSDKPVRLALEMEQGWFAARGMTAGKKILGLQ